MGQKARAKKVKENREDRRQREISAKLHLLGDVKHLVNRAMREYRICKKPGDFADIAMNFVPRLAKLMGVIDPSVYILPDGTQHKKGGGS